MSYWPLNMNTTRARRPHNTRSKPTNHEMEHCDPSKVSRLGTIFSGAQGIVASMHRFLNLDGLRKYEAFGDEFQLGSVTVVGFAIGLVGGIHLCLSVQLLIGVIRGEKHTPLVR